MSKKLVIINQNSSTVLRLGQEGVENLLRTHLGERIDFVQFMNGEEICPTLQKFKTMDDIEAIVDGGEPLEMQSPLHFKLKPKSVPVLRMELAA